MLKLRKLFIKTTQIKQFWIPTPTVDVYTQTFKEFFGNSELLLTLISLTLLVYFIRLSKERNQEISYNAVIENKTIFSFLILLPWMVVVVLIRLIRCVYL